MNPAMLAPSLLNDPNYTLSEINCDDSRVESDRDHRRSFEMVADDGEVIGYIRTWHDEDDYAGFVHFDAEGNVIDWKTFNKAPGSIQVNWN